jgi:hypothetical protein
MDCVYAPASAVLPRRLTCQFNSGNSNKIAPKREQDDSG